MLFFLFAIPTIAFARSSQDSAVAAERFLFPGKSARIKLRFEFAGFEGAESTEAVAEFGVVEVAFAEEPAKEVLGGTGALLCVAGIASGHEIAIRIAAESGARHDVVKASPAWNDLSEAVKATSGLSFVNGAARGGGPEKIRFLQACGDSFSAGERGSGYAHAANFVRQPNLYDVTVFAAFDQAEGAGVNKSMDSQTRSAGSETNAGREPC
jgi:hypothetical protein